MVWLSCLCSVGWTIEVARTRLDLSYWFSLLSVLLRRAIESTYHGDVKGTGQCLSGL